MESTDLKTMTILFRTFQAVESIARKDIATYGINMTEFAALEALYHKGRLPVQGICSKVLIANSSMTYVLDKLEKRQLLKRTRDQHDKRTYYVELTNQGRVFLEDIFPKHHAVMKKVFDVLSEDETESINELLKKVGYYAKSLDV